MKFKIFKIILWLKNGQKRELKFDPNKVNIITGNSNTGKTAILQIIDYCFLASSSKIPESVINENIEWYGIRFDINDKKYTIARKSLNQGNVSNEYYFSSTGEIPDEVIENNSESSIKLLFETEFKIDSNISVAYGSNTIKAGSKISFRYFLMFNTITSNIIENDTGVYFDKQNDQRYRDALPRIFDLAVGIETVKNVLKKDKKSELEDELSRLLRKQNTRTAKKRDFQAELSDIIKTAKEYNLIRANLGVEESLNELKKIILGLETEIDDGKDDINERDNLERDRFIIERKVRNLKRFVAEYKTYKNNLKTIDDSLKPITYLKEKDSDIIKTSIFDEMIDSLSNELLSIQKAYKAKTPIDNQVNDTIKMLEGQLLEVKEKLSILPEDNKNFENEKKKNFFLGEIKAKIDLYSTVSHDDDEKENIEKLEKKIGTIDIINTEEKKDLTIKLVEEIISEYITQVGIALENYANYQPVFDYRKKSLLLRKPKTSFIENVGSSSNHMFLHLFFSLAMQEVAFQNKSPFIAPFLIIDQPSRPYYGDDENSKENLDHSDEFKITKAFELLDKFIKTRKSNDGEFQMIVFEHIPTKIIKDFENVHLVEEFRDGNALIPLDMIRE
ncbi:MAG: DUF3732 domain-containing protein [Candidatus Lokiarchaeota archaeon]|nr:DUF3732 domain-containing protein [Candidatus Lokiarchaeota archaeon]